MPACLPAGKVTAMDFFSRHLKLRSWGCIFGGILLYALSLNLFLADNNIAAGGLAGIATVLHNLIPLRISTLILLMNIPLLLAGLATKGWQFTRNTVAGALLYSGLVELTSELPTMTSDPLVATVFGGAMYGAGMALLVLGNGSTGGTDLINRILVTYFPNISVGKMSLLVDGAVVVFAMAAFQNIEVGLYAILTIYVCSTFADKALLGFERGNLCLIITSQPPHQVADPLMTAFHRAVTEIEGLGMYAGVQRHILLAAVRPAETPKLKQLLSQADPAAFVVVIPASEVLGSNFKSLAILGKRP